MLNIMQSEFYKVLHRKCTYVFFIVFGVGGFLFHLLLKVLASSPEPSGSEVLGEWGEIIIVLGFFLTYMIAQIVHSNESKTGILKNSISYGCARTKVYIARFLTQLILLVIAVAVVGTCVMLGSAAFFHGVSMTAVAEYYKMLGLMTVLWIGTLSLAHAIAMNLNSNTLATVIYMLYFSIGPSIIEKFAVSLPDNTIFKFMNEREIYLFARNTFMLGKMDQNIANYFITGAVYLVVSFVIGLLLFRRKEVK